MIITNLLIVIALVLTLVSGLTNRLPLWVPLLLVCVALLAGRL